MMINWAVSQPGDWSYSVFWWYGTRHFCIFCQMVNRLWLVGCCLIVSLGPVQLSHFTDAIDTLYMVPVMFWWFQSPTVEPSCPGPWRTMLVCDVSSFYTICFTSLPELPVMKSAHCSAHVFSTRSGTLSAPATLFIFTLSRIFLTSAVITDSGLFSGGGVDFTAKSLLRRSKQA